MRINDEEIVARFVLRARRVEAHSLVQDREAFAELAEEKGTIRLMVDGSGTMTRSLPADEEVFESLAARVRPLVLDREPIYFKKVLDALSRLLEAAPAVSVLQREQLDQLRERWMAITGPQVQAFAVRSANLDGSDPTGMVSDAALGHGWMYADLVHADARDWKKLALDFPLRERYAAAVSVFSRIAALTVVTLRFVEQLHHSGVVVVDERVWEEPVVVGTEIVYENVTAYVAPADTEMPELDEVLGQPGGVWRQLTITDQARSNPASRVRVELAGADGTVIAAYDAALVHRSREDDVLHWHVLVAGSLVFGVQIRVEGENRVPLSMDADVAGEDYRTLLAANTFLLQLHQAQRLIFRVQDEMELQCTLEDHGPEALLQLRSMVELLEDLVVLEQLTEQAIRLGTRPLTAVERVRLRQVRLLWQGKVVQWDRALQAVVSPSGVAPQRVGIERQVMDIGGAQVRTPEVLIGHPQARWHDQGPAPDAGPEARGFTVAAPEGARLLAWSPQARPASSDEQPGEGEPWGITGIDQDAFPL